MKNVGIFLSLLAVAPSGARAELTSYEELALAAPAAEWRVTRPEWTDADEKRFGEFVTAIGKSGCRTTDACLKSAANPYRESDGPGARYFADCADLPYILRAYFAWKNELPFAYTSAVTAIPDPNAPPVPTPGPSASPTPPRDIRYSPKGNLPAARISVSPRVSANGAVVYPNGWRVLQEVSDRVSTAILRVGPEVELPNAPADFYSIKLARGSVVPGTTLYDPAGHVAVVYAVEPDGRILFIDAHPDNSLTRGTYGKKFSRSTPGQGAGFKNWRPIRLVGAKTTAKGDWAGGKLVAKKNAELKHFSVEQYFGNSPDRGGSWKKGKFVFAGEAIDYYDYLRRALSDGLLTYDPLREFTFFLRGLCTDALDRATSVTLATKSGFAKKPHPAKLPGNIFGTSGEWEDYSTPSRDARLKTSFKEAYDRTTDFVRLWRAHDSSITYTGTNLPADLRSIYARETAGCVIPYVKSNGASASLDLAELNRRLYEISFDPYHCAERRWGAEGAELDGCTDDADKSAWYSAERRLRNQIERTYDARMDYSRAELLDPRSGGALGAENPPASDLEALLRSL